MILNLYKAGRLPSSIIRAVANRGPAHYFSCGHTMQGNWLCG